MSTVLEQRSLPHARNSGWRPWVALLAGFGMLYIPTYVDLSRGLWRDDAYAHGPIIVAVFAWLVWRRRDVLLNESLKPARVAGGLMLAAGLLLYLLGRTQSLTVFEVASHIPVVLGAVLLVRGFEGVRGLAFPIFFLLFLVPLPGFILDGLTAPLKAFVSSSVEVLLRALQYPVEREGVTLWVGDVQMLVADACSGLNSLYSLFALGLLYTRITPPRSLPRTALAIAAIVPIAIAANILRVLLLVLVTVHMGHEEAQGFLHGFSGMLVFVYAFAMLLGFDKLVRRALARRGAADADDVAAARLAAGANRPKHRGYVLPLLAGLAMAVTAAAAPALKPVRAAGPAIDLEAAVPATFGDWRIDPESMSIAPAPDVQANLDRLYGQIVSRTYVNSRGEQVMLTVAHGGDQSDALKAHRQENCYAAQGFEIRELRHERLATAGRDIPVTRMLAVRGERSEPVTYWFTMGDRVVLSRGERLRTQLENGIAGRVPDGMLVRVSNLTTDAPGAYRAHESFVAALLAAMPAKDATRFVGSPRT